MATIVFNALGTAYGGPIGGAVGSLLGRQLDSALFGPSRRQGPRLSELSLTTSSYGQPLPRHFGRMRVAGSLIWATDLVESSETVGTGKGAPSVTAYSYAANFAVALASRPILGIGRIWADGKLLRGAAGDLKAGGEIRIHTGEGDQDPDPLILSAEGFDRCPAYRGLAYVVFENLDLSDFYNRIPALTFEVIADESFELADMVGEIIGDVDAAVPLPGIRGFTCEGSVAESLQTLGQVFSLEAAATGERLAIAPGQQQDAPIRLGDAFVAVHGDEFAAAIGYARHRAPSPEAPPAMLRYYDTARDYQPSLQRAAVQTDNTETGAIDLPAALEAQSAKAIIEQAARRIDWSCEQVFWRTGELDPLIVPGAIVVLPETAGLWRVAAWEWQEAGVELSLERVAPDTYKALPPLPADAGRGNPPPDRPAGATAIIAFELPLDPGGSGSDIPRPFAAVSSASADWNGAALYADHGDGELHVLGSSGRARSIIGTATSALAPASPLLFDRTSQLTVALLDPAMQLSSTDMRQLAFGANLAVVGGEILQFGRAIALGSGNWRIEGFLRGGGGTAAAIGTHVAGEAFVLLDRRPVALDPGILGTAITRQVAAIGRGDTEPVASPLLLDGITLRPLAPVHPRRLAQPDGSLRLSWTRRARGGWFWRDGTDMPLVEQEERYIVSLGPLNAPITQWLIGEPRLDIAADVLADLSSAASGASFHVRQQGTHALSSALLLHTLP